MEYLRVKPSDAQQSNSGSNNLMKLVSGGGNGSSGGPKTNSLSHNVSGVIHSFLNCHCIKNDKLQLIYCMQTTDSKGRKRTQHFFNAEIVEDLIKEGSSNGRKPEMPANMSGMN